MCLGMISIHAEWFQISDERQKQNKSVYVVKWPLSR